MIFQKKVGKLWHWTYEIHDPVRGEISQRCPTQMHDLKIKIGDTYLGRTYGKRLTFIDEIKLLDCHNNLMYIMRAGDDFEALVNKNKIRVSYEVRKDGVAEYYVEKLAFSGVNDISVYNKYAEKVANIHRNKWEDVVTMKGYTWDITIVNPGTNPIDPFILTSIASRHAFSEKNNKTDSCNDFFTFSVMWVICVTCVGIFVSICVLYTVCNK